MSQPLLLEMIERMSVAATMAFILSQTRIFRRIIYRQVLFEERVMLAVIFGLIGIMGTYAGIPVNDALANSRVIGVMAAGLIGGRLMGVSAGLIAGGHRYFLGGFTAFSCALASVCEGFLAGEIHRRYPEKPIPWWIGLAGGLAGEALQMVIILLTAKPYEMAFALVAQIAFPMTIVNSIGIAVVLVIIKTAIDVQQRAGAEQSQKALEIASKTLPYLRRGLDSESAKAAADIIFAAGGYGAVAITDEAQVLSCVGAGAEHHSGRNNSLTKATRNVLSGGQFYIAQTAFDIGCSCPTCTLASAIIVPLKRAETVIGTLKLYYTRPNAIGPADITFATGLAHLFSTQLELTEIDRQAKLAARAELKALQAQINPHFLFNTLNTITSLIRTKPDLARELLLKLGSIFRFTLHKIDHNITLAEELTQVRSYLAIEKARYGEKLKVIEDIEPAVLKYLIPSLTIQPIAENAIKHGLQPKEAGGTITVRAVETANYVQIDIIDDGVGIDLTQGHPLQLKAACSERIGLTNVHERLRGQFGVNFGLELDSIPGNGTSIRMRLPKLLNEERIASA
ncbi:sensor histidine kinase|uniref:histidine kinase n=1 Tax=Dendrosporobacter quercicolus TaxID=146817 RepID=A0A1G9TN99_9FIRM|nr:sensor histidine kinase [Dendrosporobacter quercicolus]NSL48907.1 sensor histidine kinase [Dendrosporobacter quercicolus DSM 1736]SDM49163.1 two-component system, LytT family, sensor histidine kinase LytS [Dendrosporobacter quercicolus]